MKSSIENISIAILMFLFGMVAMLYMFQHDTFTYEDWWLDWNRPNGHYIYSAEHNKKDICLVLWLAKSDHSATSNRLFCVEARKESKY